MSLPVYFVSQGRTAPEKGKHAASGWHCAPDGTLVSPDPDGPADALVFDDRIALPEQPDALAEALLAQARRIGAEVIVLDLERPVSPSARFLAGSLAGMIRIAAPVRFCSGACEPICSYSPSAQTFSEFLETARGWIELRPVRESVRYPMGSDAPQEGPDCFSPLLQCRYRASQTKDELILDLFDTPETFRARFELGKERFRAAVGLQCELDAMGFPDGHR